MRDSPDFPAGRLHSSSRPIDGQGATACRIGRKKPAKPYYWPRLTCSSNVGTWRPASVTSANGPAAPAEPSTSTTPTRNNHHNNPPPPRGGVEPPGAPGPARPPRHEAAAEPALEKLVGLSFAVARAFRDDVLVRAGARLWAERKSIDVEMPPPFVDWIATVERMLTQARADGDLAPGADPSRDAPTLVAAFFGLHTLSDALDDRLLIEDRLTDLWLLLLPSLQADPAPRKLLDTAGAQAAAEASGQ